MALSPKMDEQNLLRLLSDLSIPMTPLAWRQTAAMVILDCWDRRLERPFFASILDLSVELDSLMATIEKGGAMRYCLTTLDEDRDPVMLDEQLNGIVTQFMRKRHQMAEKFALVCQCPHEGSTIS